MGAPDIIPWSFKNAITEPEKVIAPTAAPIAISIKLASLIFPGVPKPKGSGLIKADIATGAQENIIKIGKSKISKPYIFDNSMYLVRDNAIIKINWCF